MVSYLYQVLNRQAGVHYHIEVRLHTPYEIQCIRPDLVDNFLSLNLWIDLVLIYILAIGLNDYQLLWIFVFIIKDGFNAFLAHIHRSYQYVLYINDKNVISGHKLVKQNQLLLVELILEKILLEKGP